MRGATAISDIVKLPQFSAIESNLLQNAITLKTELISKLRNDCISDKRMPLPFCDRYKMKAHFDKKLKFYKEENVSKWSHWPQKRPADFRSSEKKNTVKNFKLRRNRKIRKITRDAERALNQGGVVVMIEEEVPLGAIALLGKGLNFIPTPSTNVLSEQLDMRLVQNKILKHANKSEDSPVFNSRIPSSLVKTNYGLSRVADESSVNAIV